MRRLDRYVLRDFLLYSLMGAILFVGIYLIVDVFEKLDTFVDNKASLQLVIRYYLWSLPVFLVQVLPLAVMLGSVLALGQLRRYNEVTAMQGAGISPVRIAAPLLACSLLISGGIYALSELTVPDAYRTQKRILKVEIKGQEPEEATGRMNVRLLGRGGNFYLVEFFEGAQGGLRNVSVQTLDGDRIVRRIDAKRAVWRDGSWRFSNGYLRTFADSAETTLPFRFYSTSDLEETPADFARPEEDPFRMNMRDLAQYAEKVKASGGREVKILVDYHLRASFPLSALIMVLIGASLSLRIVRGGGIAIGVGATFFVGFAYLACLRAGQALGYTETVPPFLAAWLGNIVFGSLGIVFFWKVTR